jgi:nucleotide-binding universal stress UspA family protein
MTGLMQLDPGTTPARPRVTRTARKAIIPVMLEVCVMTVLFGLAMHAIPGMGAREHEGDMLRHLGKVFVDDPLGRLVGLDWLRGRAIFSWIISLVLAGLLLSAVNTAIAALVSIQYLICKDDELPRVFGMLNRFGVPWIVLLISMLAPILVIDLQRGENTLHGLAAMYGIGVVGAIVTNLGSTAFNFKLPMVRHERIVMMLTFLVLAAVEITIAVTKPAALAFAVIILGLGLVARALHKGFKLSAPVTRLAAQWFPVAAARSQLVDNDQQRLASLAQQLGPVRPVNAVMVAARGVTPTLRYAVEEAGAHNAELFVLFVREQHTTIPVPQVEQEDQEAQGMFNAVKSIAGNVPVTTIYAVSDDPAWTILDNAALAGVDLLILGHSRRAAVTRMLRGDLLTQVAAQLPEEIRLVVVG